MLPARPARIVFALLALAAAVTAAPAQARTDSSASVRFSAIPRRAFQGRQASATVAVSGRAFCALYVRYKGGDIQPGLSPKWTTKAHASWRWKVPGPAEPGPAQVTASCGGAGTVSRTLMIVGSVIPARINVVKSGFSVRAKPYGGGVVSYGVILANGSPNEDALNVNVLVNFVMPDNALIGSASSNITGIPAGSQYVVGGDLSFAGGVPPVARLEIVVQIGRRAAGTHAHPGVAAIRVVPNPYEPAWVGSVEGELINDNAKLTLQSAEISAVVLDFQGNVVGGGAGFAFATLPPGAREFIKISNGFSAIPFPQAVSALVSVMPTYRPAGT